ncbi:TPA: restriction endonuclease subunit S [Vibrio cholerae]|nr:restriction endonuclease subunit S [Vibrio cholerae]
MSKFESKGLVPELRFSQFIGGTEWQKKPFNKLYTLKVTNSLSRDKLNYDDGLVKNIHYGDIHTKFSTLFDITKEYVPFINTEISLDKVKEDSYCQEGDMVFADASEDIDDVGKSIELINLNGEKLLSGLHTILARQKGSYLVKGFGGYLFKSEVMRKQIQKESQGAKVLGISATRISNIELIYPIDHDEQQKIADCLSSMDDLITTNTKKLDSLKLHKKGLLQKLFPAEGENKPDFRFPEFSMEANWKKEKLHNLVDLLSGHAFKSEYFSATGKKMVTPKNFTKNGFASFSEDNTKYTSEDFNERYICREGDLLLLLTDLTPSCELLGRPMLLTPSDGEVLLNQRIAKVILKGNINSNFLKYFFLSNSFRKRIINTATGSTVRHTSNKIVLSTELLLPNLSEQNKIAACLLSIDELIRSQADKIETLKEYKKGLMQQLFPEMKESIA